MRQPDPDKVIAAIRRSFIGSEQVYTFGSCVAFYFILKEIFPKAKPYWSAKARHMITRIGRYYYDISGRVERPPDYELDDKEEYGAMPVVVAFPQKTERRVRFTTPRKL